MKSMRYFLTSLLALSYLILFPVQSRAEEEVERDPTSTEEQEQLLETEMGEIVVSANEFTVGETVQITFKPKDEHVKYISGSLQLQKGEEPYEQTRLLSFLFDEQTESWTASYTISPYDLGGDWGLHLTSFGEEDEKLQEETLELITINNDEPALDEEPPVLEQFLILDKEETIHVTKGEAFTVQATVNDVASAVKGVYMYIEGESGRISFPLNLSENRNWTATYEITESLPAGTYEIFVEMSDTAGNGTVVPTQYKLIVEQDEQEIGTDEDEATSEIDDEKEEVAEEAGNEEVLVTVTEPEKTNQNETGIEQSEVQQEEQEQLEVKDTATSPEKSEADAEKQKAEQKEEPKEESSIFDPSYLFSIIAGLFLLGIVLKNNTSWE